MVCGQTVKGVHQLTANKKIISQTMFVPGHKSAVVVGEVCHIVINIFNDNKYESGHKRHAVLLY